MTDTPQVSLRQPASPPARPSGPSLGTILRRRWWLILLVVVGAMGVTLIGSLNAPPAYRTALRLQVFVLDDEEVALYTRPRTETASEQVFVTQNDFSDVLRSPLIAWRTISDLGLDKSAAELLGDLEINVSGEFVTVAYEASSPQEAQDVLSRHVDNALSHYAGLRARPAVATGQFLQAELAAQAKALADTQEDLLGFQLEHNVGDLPREINAVQDELRVLEASRDAAQVEASRADALAAQWHAAADEAETRAASTLEALAQQQASAEAADETSLQAQELRIATLREEVADQQALARTYRTTALTQGANAVAQRAASAAQDSLISMRAADLAQLIGLSDDYEDLVTAVRNAQTDYDFLRAKAVEASLKERQISDVGSLQVVEPAFLPAAPAPSPVLRLTLLAAVVSLLVGLVLALLLDLASPRRRQLTEGQDQ